MADKDQFFSFKKIDDLLSRWTGFNEKKSELSAQTNHEHTQVLVKVQLDALCISIVWTRNDSPQEYPLHTMHYGSK